MILPKPLPEIRFTRICILMNFPMDFPAAEIHSHPAHQHLICIYPWGRWAIMPEILKWFIIFHESFHTIQGLIFDLSTPKHLIKHEWEADWYACRIFASFGYDLEKLSKEYDRYLGRPLYMPFSAEYIKFLEDSFSRRNR